MTPRWRGAWWLIAAAATITALSAWLYGCSALSHSEAIQTVLAGCTIPFALWFLTLYLPEKNWWRSAFPTSLVIIAVAVFLYSSSVVLFRLFGDYPGRDVLLVASSGMTLVAMAMRTLVVRRERRKDR